MSICYNSSVAQSNYPCEKLKERHDAITQALLKANDYVSRAMAGNPFDLSAYEEVEYYTYHDSAYQLLDSLLHLQEIVAYDLECLLESIDIQYSKDKRFWIFTWDENSGGSFQSSVTLLHGRGTEGEVFPPQSPAPTTTDGDENPNGEYIGGDLWGHLIGQIDTLDQTFYIVEESARTCNTCTWWRVVIYKVSDSGEVIEYQNIGKGARIFNLDGQYDTVSRTITLRYIVDDLNSDAEQTELLNKYSKIEADPFDKESELYWNKLVTETWQFNGRKFELHKVTIEDGDLLDE